MVTIIESSISGPVSIDVHRLSGNKTRNNWTINQDVISWTGKWEQYTPVDLIKGTVKNAVKVTQINRHLNVRGHIGQNIVIIVTKTRILVSL